MDEKALETDKGKNGTLYEPDFKRSSRHLKIYSLGEVSTITPLSYGISNSNFKVLVIKNGQIKPFLLKISNDKNKNELRGEQEILHF